MTQYLLFYDDGDDCPDQFIGVYPDKAAAEADIIPHARRYGDGVHYQQFVKGFYIEEVSNPSIRIKPMEWSTGPDGTLYAIDGLGGEWTITHSFGRSTAVRRHGTATVETINAAIPAADMAKLVQSLWDDRIRAMIVTTEDKT